MKGKHARLNLLRLILIHLDMEQEGYEVLQIK